MRRRLLAPLLALLVVVPMAAPAAVAQDTTGDVAIDYHQSVHAQVSNVGRVRDAKVVTQMTATGDGPVQITASDAATKGLRNLDGFGKPAVSDGALTWDLDLAGTEKTRTIADFDKDLPLAVTVDYELDGETVRPSRMRNRSGIVTVNYTVENTTAVPTEVAYKDPEGGTVTETVDVVVPYVATLTLALPGEFRDIQADGATIYGDGQGNTIVRWTMLLFEPLGESTAEVSVTARSRRGTVPGATLEAIPVSSGTFASLASALEQYDGAEQDTRALRNGARDLDRGAIRLAAGVSRLLDGMTQLADGGEQLRDGLFQARDGAAQVADGNASLASGLDEGFGLTRDGASRVAAGNERLASGLGVLRDGAFALEDGAGRARDGAVRIADGNNRLAGGLADLRDGAFALRDGTGAAASGGVALAQGLSELEGGAGAARLGAEAILGGLTEIQAGLGMLADEGAGLPFAAGSAAQLRDGVEQIHAGMVGVIIPGLESLSAVASQLAAGLPVAKQGVDDVHAGLTENLSPNLGNLNTATAGQIAGLEHSLATLCGGDPTSSDECTAIGGARDFLDDVVSPTLLTLKGAIDGLLAPGLDQVSTGLASAIVGANALDQNLPALHAGLQTAADALSSGDMSAPGVLEGLIMLTLGLESAADGVTQLFAGSGLAVGGQQQLVEGLVLLEAGAGQASSGAASLSGGLTQLFDGSSRLASGSRDAASGAGELADGSNTLAGGLSDLSDGSQRLAVGGSDAASGAGELADGSRQLADGLDEFAGRAQPGAEELAAGSQRLSDGLVDAADGGSRLADGMKLATVGGGQAADGAETLQETGTEVLLEKVSEGFSGRSELAAHLHAVDERGASEGLPYGAPEEANATAAYRFLIAGAADTGGAGDAGRGLVGVLLLLGAVVLGGFARQRLLV